MVSPESRNISRLSTQTFEMQSTSFDYTDESCTVGPADPTLTLVDHWQFLLWYPKWTNIVPIDLDIVDVNK